MQSLLELAKNVNVDRKSCSHGGGLGALDTLDDVLQGSVGSRGWETGNRAKELYKVCWRV